MSGFAFDSYLPVASFALAAGALAVRFFVAAGTPKQVLITSALIFILLTSAILWRKEWQVKRQIRDVGAEVVAYIGNDKRSYDDVLVALRHRDSQIVTAALDYMVDHERVGSTHEIVTGPSGGSFRVRLYHVRSFARLDEQ